MTASMEKVTNAEEPIAYPLPVISQKSLATLTGTWIVAPVYCDVLMVLKVSYPAALFFFKIHRKERLRKTWSCVLEEIFRVCGLSGIGEGQTKSPI